MKPVVLLRNSEDTETNRALLTEHGYETLFRFSAALDDGTQDEILYLSFVWVYSCHDLYQSFDRNAGFCTHQHGNLF